MKERSTRTVGALVLAVTLATLGASTAAAASSAAGAAPPTPGVTKTAIRIGVTSIDLKSVAQFTHGLTEGNIQGAFTALIDNLNEHGGIDGRKLVPTFVSPSPLESSSSDAACVQLTEDDKVFAVIGQFYATDPQCYVGQHATPVVGGSMTNATLASAKAPWFTVSGNTDVLEPEVAAVAAQAGVFKGKTVGVLSASNADPGVVASVLSELKRHGVKPKITATIESNNADVEAEQQQLSGVFVPKFEAAGVNVLVAVGEAATTWVDASGGGSYHPLLVATNDADVAAGVSGSSNPAVVKGTVTAGFEPVASGGKARGWADPSLQRCASIIKAAGVTFSNPVTVKNAQNYSYTGVTIACQTMALFTAIATKAGRHLTNASFAAAGNTLGSVEIPGLGTGTFDKAHPSGSFPLYLYRWDVSTNQWVVGTKPYGTT